MYLVSAQLDVWVALLGRGRCVAQGLNGKRGYASALACTSVAQADNNNRTVQGSSQKVAACG